MIKRKDLFRITKNLIPKSNYHSAKSNYYTSLLFGQVDKSKRLLINTQNGFRICVKPYALFKPLEEICVESNSPHGFLIAKEIPFKVYTIAFQENKQEIITKYGGNAIKFKVNSELEESNIESAIKQCREISKVSNKNFWRIYNQLSVLYKQEERKTLPRVYSLFRVIDNTSQLTISGNLKN